MNQQREKQLIKLLNKLGIPCHIKGYGYLKESIKYCYANQEALSSITGTLYPAIAKSNDTAPQNIERTIRYAIGEGWKNKPQEMINFFASNEKPTNSEFIATAIEKLK